MGSLPETAKRALCVLVGSPTKALIRDLCNAVLTAAY